MAKIKPIHPGEILYEDFMVPLGLSANKLADRLGVPSNRISAIVSGRRGITADTAIRLSAAFDTTPEFWTNLQAHYELEIAKEEKRPAIKKFKYDGHDGGTAVACA